MRSKLIAAGAGLFGYGALVGWAVTADFFEYKMKSNQRTLGDIINRKTRELESAKTLLLNNPTVEELDDEAFDSDESNVEIEKNPGGDVPAEFLEGEDQPLREAAEEEEEEYSEEKSAEIRAHLQGVINEYTQDDEAIDHFAHLAEPSMRPDVTPPFVISRGKFAWDEEEGDEYEKITLTYYPRERLLLDDENEPVASDEVGDLVGWRNLSRFGDESEDAEVVFVRNRRLKTDFEVIRDTENQPPAHVRFGMGREEFETQKAAGLIRFGRENSD